MVISCGLFIEQSAWWRFREKNGGRAVHRVHLYLASGKWINLTIPLVIHSLCRLHFTSSERGKQFVPTPGATYSECSLNDLCRVKFQRLFISAIHELGSFNGYCHHVRHRMRLWLAQCDDISSSCECSATIARSNEAALAHGV